MAKETFFFLFSVSITTLLLSFFTAFVYTKAFPMSVSLSSGIRLAGFIFPFLYVSANVLSRFANIESIRWFYTIMSVGAGIAFYLLLGAILLAILLVIYKILGRSLPVSLSWTILVFSILMSFIGAIQARDIKKVSYEVVLENLPSSWENKKAILFSDTHYGLVNNKRASQRLVNKIIKEEPHAVFIAGDLFDGPNIETSELVSVWLEMSLKYPVFYAPGNHEEYGNYEKFIKATELAGFNVLEDKVVVYEGVNILGLKYRTRSGEKEVDSALKNMRVDNSMPTIVINHPPTFLKSLETNGANLMLSGHTHRGQFWPLRYITKAVYGKYYLRIKQV